MAGAFVCIRKFRIKLYHRQRHHRKMQRIVAPMPKSNGRFKSLLVLCPFFASAVHKHCHAIASIFWHSSNRYIHLNCCIEIAFCLSLAKKQWIPTIFNKISFDCMHQNRLVPFAINQKEWNMQKKKTEFLCGNLLVEWGARCT